MKRYELLALLLELAKQGCARAPVRIDKTLIASNLEISAWTLNKWLKEAASLGYIEGVSKGRGKRYMLTPKAIKQLRELQRDLTTSLKKTSSFVLVGRVFSGIGEGAYYVSLASYREKLKQLLGFEPYPGTLNLRLDPTSAAKRKALESYNGFRIPPLVEGGKTYCGVKVFKALVNGEIEAGVVIPEKTVYGVDVLEVVSNVCLREALKLRDGDIVKVEVFL